MHRDLEAKRSEIARLCRHYGVRRLEVFGSAARGEDFDPATSDVDFIVEFGPESGRSPLEEFFGLRASLAEVLGRPVDLVEPRAVRNPYIRSSIDARREVVYAT